MRTDMKIFVVPAVLLVIVLLGFFVKQQSELRRQQEIERVVSNANTSLNLIESNRYPAH